MFAFVPRNKTPLQLAALTGVLLLGFQLVLTYWIYAYIPWFFPFVAYATLAPRVREEPWRCRPPTSDFRLSPLRFISAAASALAIFIASWAALHQDRFKRGEIVDTPVYQNYGDAMWRGEVPYRDFACRVPAGRAAVLLPAGVQGGGERRQLPAVVRGADRRVRARCS